MNSHYNNGIAIPKSIFGSVKQYKRWLRKVGASIKFAVSGVLLLIALGACKKLIEVEPPSTSVNEINVYATDATAAAVLTGIYGTMSLNNLTSGGITSMSLFPGLSADELTLYSAVLSPSYNQYYRNALTSSNTGGIDLWSKVYPNIYIANAAIEGLTASSSLTPAVKQQLIGEAKFIRAFCYFYLVNLYGDVPLSLSTDYKVNTLLARASKIDVYQQIVSDLVDARELLNSNYVGPDVLTITTERTRPTKWAATALLARVYLFIGDWINAEKQATDVIDATGAYSLIVDLKDVFLANSREAIWQLQPVIAGYNTQDARLFVLPETGPDAYSYIVYLSSSLLNSFEVNDQRKIDWMGSVTVPVSGVLTPFYYPHKYKINATGAPVTEYLMVLRLAEQYLIRAEARAHLGNIANAVADLNIIRARAGLDNTSATTQAALLAAIQHERRVELFTEWGHRWLDIKRMGTVDAVMTSEVVKKGSTWNANWQWYPIPLSELQRAPNLVQNNGY